MILIVGGKASGKREYVLSLGYQPEQLADGVLNGQPVLLNLQDMVMAAPDKAPELLPELLKKEVVVCDEVGSGVIPMGKDRRLGREATGRLCCRLAEKAEKVVRMVSGIPTVIKG